MTIAHNYLRTRVRVGAVVANYKLLGRHGGHIIPVIKADAYGHGLAPVARGLAAAGADTFAIGSVAEGAALRETEPGATILSLVGPVLPEDDELVLAHDLVPFIHDFGQLDRLAALSAKTSRPFGIAVKCDTGMARLGFVEADLDRLIARLKSIPGLTVRFVASHLATADDPNAFDFVDEQGSRFATFCQALTRAGFQFEASLCNSAGILAHERHGWQAKRAGIALYGVNPFRGTDREALGAGLVPAMETVTRIVSVHDLPRGSSISYGRTYMADRDRRVAIVAAGYADAYSRGLSNTGFMWISGRRVPILGRVCMQLTAVDVTGIPDVAPGDAIHLLGGQGPEAITADDLADWWGTIPYEVFCLFGLNPREYLPDTPQ
jgi:alanine racemase